MLSNTNTGFIREYIKAADIYLDVTAEEAVYIKKFLQNIVTSGTKILNILPAPAIGAFGFLGAENADTFGSVTNSAIGGKFISILA